MSQGPLKSVVTGSVVGYPVTPVHRRASAVPELLLYFSPCGQDKQGHQWLREPGLCTGAGNKDSGVRLTRF